MVGAETPFKEVVQIISGYDVKRLPVVDETGRLVGVVSRADRLRFSLRQDPAIREETSGDVLDRSLGFSLLGLLDRSPGYRSARPHSAGRTRA